jgi:hypothetical protein
MESLRGRFTRVVIHHLRGSEVRTDGTYGDNVAVVVLDHGWEELLYEAKVADGVDGEGQLNIRRRSMKNGFAAADTGVVDEDGWVPDFAADALADDGYVVNRGEVNFKERDVLC